MLGFWTREADKQQYKIKAEAEKLFEKERASKKKVKKALAKAKALADLESSE